ncbi:MAG: hypothetical protein JXB85_08465 [Anaerolineales bacterium]|nr:hypothetical protein [Anaerolineales bacterium]
MRKAYHRAITGRALAETFSRPALATIISANLKQDAILSGQIGHPEYHFDENAFAESWAYLESNRALIHPALAAGQVKVAWRAFGRLLHAAQDLYSHSNYIRLWLSRFPEGEWPEPEAIDPCDAALLASHDLRSGKLYYPLEILTFLPVVGDWVMPFLPRDSHAWMNLDAPTRGPLFAYASAAAVKRTCYEYARTVEGWPQDLLRRFHG